MQKSINEDLLTRLNSKLDQFNSKIDVLLELFSQKEDVQWLSPKEAARFMGVSERSMRTYLAGGLVKSSKVAGRVYIKKLDLVSLIENPAK